MSGARIRRASIAALLVLGAGCAGTPRSGPPPAHVWRSASGVEMIADGAECHKVIRLDPQSSANEWVDIPCQSVALTQDPADEEFWTFKAHPEQKTQMTVLGIVPVGPAIPSGRISISVRVVGTVQVCEAVRKSIARGRPVNDLESGAPGIPTEPCVGPGYFKRLA